MATMPRDPMLRGLTALILACLPVPQVVWAQSQSHAVVPTLGIRMEHTDNVDGVSDASVTGKRSEDILTVSPALEIRHQGPHTQAEGRFGLLAEHRLQSTSSDRVVPDGRLRLRTEPAGRGVGLEASLQAQQVKPAVSSSGGTSAATANTVTETQASLSPFVARRLGNGYEVFAQAQGLHTRSDPRLDTARASKVHSFTAQAGLVRRPAPFGYALEVSSLRERQKADTPDVAGGAAALREDGSTQQSALKATLLYAFGPELELGVIAGDEKDERRIRSQAGASTVETERRFDGGFVGFQATWRPGPRTELRGLVEDRRAARTWSLDASHRLRRTTFALSDRQVATRNAPLSVSARSIAESGGLSLTPSPSAPSSVPPTTQPLPGESTALISVQRTSSLRVTHEGVRSVLTLTAGQFRARSLIAQGNAPEADRSRFHGFEASYRLSPQLTPSMGLRWSRATDATGLSRRERLFTMGLRVRLSAATGLDGGAAILSSRTGPTLTSPSDQTRINSIYVRLEHRF